MWCSPVKFGGDSGCGAASIGYRRRIRKGFRSQPGHRAVAELLSSEKLSLPPRLGVATEAVPTVDVGMRAATSIHYGFARRMRFILHSRGFVHPAVTWPS